MSKEGLNKFFKMALDREAAAETGPNCHVIFGSFFMGNSEQGSTKIHSSFPADAAKAAGLRISEAPVEGNKFDFNALANTKVLVVITSSQYGTPPPNFWEFYYHLKVASENSAQPLAGLQHAVFGHGDEPHAPLDVDMCRVEEWAPQMWEAALAASTKAPAITWDAHWAKKDSHVHRKITDNTLAKIMDFSGDGKPPATHPSMFAKL
eukprot:g135.t1